MQTSLEDSPQRRLEVLEQGQHHVLISQQNPMHPYPYQSNPAYYQQLPAQINQNKIVEQSQTQQPSKYSAFSQEKMDDQPEIIPDYQAFNFNSTIKPGIYFDKRKDLIKWLRRQCKRFKVYWETYANSLYLMDKYYRQKDLDKLKFVEQGLCIIIISTKAFETKVLFTQTIAKNNQFNFQQTLQVERKLIQFFNYQISSYNFVRVVLEYMARWDQKVSMRKDIDIFFLKQKSIDQYKLHLQVLFHCENYLLGRKSLFQKDIKAIFKYVLNSQENTVINKIINQIFQDPVIERSKQYQYCYEILPNLEPPQLAIYLQQNRREFQKSIPQIQERYKEYLSDKQGKVFKSYGEFISLLF